MGRDPAWRRYVRFFRDDAERDVDEELAAHFDLLVDRHLAHGKSRAEAVAAARLAFRGASDVAEQCTELSRVRGARRDWRAWVDELITDMRVAARLAWARPRASLAMVLTAATALVAASVVFLIADRLFLQRPAFLADAGRTHRAYVYGTAFFGEKRFLPSFSYPQFERVASTSQVFDGVAAVYSSELLVGSPKAAPRWASVTIATPGFWSMFDTRPHLGRYFGAADDTLPVAVISYEIWKARFGEDRNVPGQALRVGAATYRIIGVMPRGMYGLAGPPVGVVLPLRSGMRAVTANPSSLFESPRGQWLSVVVRRRPGVSVAAAASALSRALDAGTPDTATPPPAGETRAVLAPIQRARGPSATTEGRLTWWMALLAAFLGVATVSNLAGLQRARLARRRREIALRTALGMSRRRLARMIACDTVLQLGVAGVVATVVGPSFVLRLGAAVLPELVGFRADESLRIVMFIIAAAALVALVVGVVVLMTEGTRRVVDDLKDADGRSRRGGAIDGGGTVIQTSTAMVLVAVATMFLFSWRDAATVRLGYDADRLLWVTAQPRHAATREALRSELARLRGVLLQEQHVAGVALADQAPRMAYSRVAVFVGDSSSPTPISLAYHRVSPEYFATLGMHVRAGRGFSASAAAAGEIVVNEGMARGLAPNGNILGTCIRLINAIAQCRTVVGVVDNVRDARLEQAVTPGFYVAPLPDEEWQSGLIVRAGAVAHIAELQHAAARLSTSSFSIESYPVRTLITEGRRPWQASAAVLALLSGAAVLLTMVGLSATIAEDATRRTHDFALRAALGAGPWRLLALVVSDSAKLLARTIGVGGPVAFGIALGVRPLLFADAAVVIPLLVGALLVAIVIAGAGVLPAAHLRKVDVMRALRATR